MLGCSTVCPNCKHQFQCCPQPTSTQPTSTQLAPSVRTECCRDIRPAFHHLLAGGAILTTPAPMPPAIPPQPPPSLTTTTTCPLSPSPQISPSIRLAFVLPPFAAPTSNQTIYNASPPDELERLARTLRHLRATGWYYEQLSYERSNELLKHTKIGTFLVRNSSDSRYLYSLSVQTNRGPTSVRLDYVNGRFRLNAQSHLIPLMPLFDGVIELIEYYVRQSIDGDTSGVTIGGSPHVWVDPQGKWYSPIRLVRPLRKEGSIASLKHLARLIVNRRSRKNGADAMRALVELPASLRRYLDAYPFVL